MANEQQIATALAEDASSTGVAIISNTNVHRSHLRTLLVGGTFGGTTVSYQVSQDDSTWFSVTGADAITSATAINVEHRCKYHRILTVGGAGAAINAWVI